MSKKKKPVPVAAGTGSKAVKTEMKKVSLFGLFDSNIELEKKAEKSLPKISDFLHEGQGNPITARDLVALTGLSSREVYKHVERERNMGVPIIAGDKGFYLPATLPEAEAWLKRSKARRQSAEKTENAVKAWIKNQKEGGTSS
jgi:biotin operon repressor